MPDETLKKLLDNLNKNLSAWLEAPSPASQKLSELKAGAAELKATLGPKAVADLMKPFERAEAQAKRVRQREAADAVAAALKPLGVILEAKEPPQRVRRKAVSPAPIKVNPSLSLTKP